MGLVDSITSSHTLALDTNVLITAFNQPASLSGKLLDKIQKVNPQVFISTIVFEEFLVKIYQKKLQKNIAYYEDFVTGQGLFIVVSVNRDIARKAAKIRAQFDIKAPDAIHLATAIESRAKIFVTTDKRLPKKIENLTIKVL